MGEKELTINQQLALEMYNYYASSGASVPEDIINMIEGPVNLEPGEAVTLPAPAEGSAQG